MDLAQIATDIKPILERSYSIGDWQCSATTEVSGVRFETIDIELVWHRGAAEVARAIIFFHPESQRFFWLLLQVTKESQREGLYSAIVERSIENADLLGVLFIEAPTFNARAALVLATAGFEQTTAHPFELDLKGERAQEFLKYRRGGEQPSWRAQVIAQLEG